MPLPTKPPLTLYRARLVLPRPDELLDGGGLLVEDGRISAVFRSAADVRRCAGRADVRVQDLGEGILTPGLVNAHAHLELGWARGRLDGSQGFAPWVGELVRARRGTTPAEELEALSAGLARALATGTTLVADVDASDAYDQLPDLQAAPRVLRLREVLDAGSPGRAEASSSRIAAAPAARPGCEEGLSPHAPFTVGRDLLRTCAQVARARALHVQVHWAESAEEREWLLYGRGPFAAVLGESPRASGLDLLDEAGLLRRGLSLVHANHPERPDAADGDPARLAAAGCGVVHCPGSHAFFGREPFPWRRWLAAGVPLALGTDSLASNADLDLRRELALAAAAPGAPPPAVLWRTATVGGALVLGRNHQLGRLAAGLHADLATFEAPAHVGGLDAVLEHLVLGRPALRAVVVRGRPHHP